MVNDWGSVIDLIANMRKLCEPAQVRSDDQTELLGKTRIGRSSFVTLKGIYLAKLWIVAPALIALPVMWLFGEGDYVVPILGVLWALCFLRGLRIRANAPLNSVERSQGFHISLWSFILAAVMATLTVSFVVGGIWRWKPPAHGWPSIGR